jgi:GNAT superfamily N-acetyltransferase
MGRDQIFLNHLAFMDRHRGGLVQDRAGVEAIGPNAELTSWIPAADDSPLPPRCRAVRLAPWSGRGWTERLTAAGFSPAEKLSYMAVARPIESLETGVSIRRGSTKADAHAFAQVQSEGFLVGQSESNDWWREYFVENALRNIADPDQDFLLAGPEGRPVACMLVLRASGAHGIYAVATRPAERRQGYSAALLNHACQQAAARDDGPIVLQAMTGSYAERFYAERGFALRYHSQVWRLPERS